jgi:hypothetical protein
MFHHGKQGDSFKEIIFKWKMGFDLQIERKTFDF